MNLASERVVRSELRSIARIQEGGARASGSREAGLNVTERDLDVVAMFGPSGGVQEANDGDRSGDSADQKKDQGGYECKQRLFSRRHWEHFTRVRRQEASSVSFEAHNTALGQKPYYRKDLTKNWRNRVASVGEGDASGADDARCW